MLEYTNQSSAKWLKNMKNNDRYVVSNMDTGYMFTELGVYRALLKSDKPIAE